MGRARSLNARVFALFLATLAFVQQALSAPADIFVSSAPAVESPSPQGRDIEAGDASVSTQTGALNYSYPIEVPPGRNGMSPKLALAYSNQAPIYGGIAAGWTLSIPEIREDVSQGRLATRDPMQAVNPADDRFVSSIAGNARLVKVPTTVVPSDAYGVYLAQGDTSGTRYERITQPATAKWRVLTVDGATMLFGETARTNGSAVGGTACTNISENYAPLTTLRDSFGNEIRYEYAAGVPNECELRRISWGFNANAGFTQAFAKVELTYQSVAQCVVGEASYIGAQLDYRTGTKIVTGARRLTEIRATAFNFGGEASPLHTRVIALGYWDATSGTANTESCSLSHAPVRLLRSIQETAWGPSSPQVTLPPVTFNYGTPAVDLSLVRSGSVPWSDASSTHTPHPGNLGWGRRPDPNADDEWPTVEAMMLDIDGDGLQDRVYNTSGDQTDGSCKATWRRNTGHAPASSANSVPQFGGGNDIALPRIRWHKVSGSSTGSPTALDAASEWEHCSLNGQVTSYRNVSGTASCHDGSACAFSTTPGLTGKKFCYSPSGFGLQCPDGVNSQVPYRSYLAYRWLDVTADGLPDLVAAVHGDIKAYDIVHGTDSTQSDSATPFGVPWPACPAMDRCKDVTRECITAANGNWQQIQQCFEVPSAPCGDLTTAVYSIPGAPSPLMERRPYYRCEGLYPWMIYKNKGRGVFETTPTIKYSPVPLESSNGDSNIGGTSITSVDHTIADLDGDGILDAAIVKEGTSVWQVWRGDGTGGFAPRRYEMLPHSQNASFFANLAPATNYGSDVQSSVGLVDLNGDGLSEHWLLGASSTDVCWSNGTSFDNVTGATFSSFVKPGDDATFTATWQFSKIVGGTMKSNRRVLDVDNDGRPDVSVAIGTGARVYLNHGGLFNAASPYLGDPTGLFHLTRATPENVDSERPWEVLDDVIDLDGDGIAESVSMPSMTRKVHDTTTGPPRLLVSISNGRGATTTVTYASMHDKNFVEQNPSELWPPDAFDPNGRPKATPTNRWVTATVQTSDAFAGTTTTTSHYYKNPRHGANDEGRYDFRGFQEVRTNTPTGSQIVELYDYLVDWSGRLVETRVLPTPGATEARTIERTNYVAKTLYSGLITGYHVAAKESFTCANAQAIAACTATAAAAYTKVAVTQMALTNSAAEPVLWVDTEDTLQAGIAIANGDRRNVRTMSFSSTTAQHRLKPLTTTREHLVSGAWVMFAKTANTWDPTLRAMLTDETWFDTDNSHRAITRYDYYMDTGLVKERWKPVQNEANTTRTVFSYDSRKLFAVSETNELNHVRNYTYDYGLGIKLKTTGPNAATGGTCPSGSMCLPNEQSEIKVDGLGRTLENWETVSYDGSVYVYHLRSTASYVDAVTVPSTPSSVTKRIRIDATAPTWTQSRADMDGLGRVSKETVFVQGTAPADQVSTFTYSNAGLLVAAERPDPSADNAARVQYVYTYDTLGRLLTLRRPDSTNKSGLNIDYDGVTTISTDVVGDGGGTAACTKSTKDRFGRLALVEEKTGPSSWAATAYSYAPDDTVKTITDPQGALTTLTHDFSGRRTLVARGSRQWAFTYTKNGNLESEVVPGWTSAAQKPFFTTTYAYDDLDRRRQRLNGQRALGTADQAAFGNATETYTYDVGGNMRGRLRFYSAYAPGSSTASVSIDTMSTTQGQRYLTTQTLNVAGFGPLTRSYSQTFYLFGGVQETTYNDQVGGGTEDTRSTIYYDARGLPEHLQVVRGSLAVFSVAAQTRNVAGLVRRRRTTLPSSQWVESVWSYDKLGRVTRQSVGGGPTKFSVASQDIAYFGNDDPKFLSTSLSGTTPELIDFTYDGRHQLSTATSSSVGYFTGSYAYGDAGRLVSVNEGQSPLAAGSEVKPRNVNYVYGGADPEQVTALTNVSGGSTYASFEYDLAGNMTRRCVGGAVATCTGAGMERLEYAYDGRDQLRRAKRYVANTLIGSEEYWYDADGTRIVIVKRDSSNTKTEMVWFIGDTEAYYDPSGVVAHVFSNISLETPVARVHRTADTVASIEYQFHGLANGTLATVSSNGSLVSGFRYSPWGEVLDTVGTSVDLAAQKRRFNDKYVDSVSKLAYYGARYFDRLSLTWTQSDKLFTTIPDARKTSPRSAALYAFSMQNSMRYIDPDGNSPQDVVNSLHVPTKTELQNGFAAHQKLAQSAQNGTAAAQQTAEKASVAMIYKMLKADLHGTHLAVGDLSSKQYDAQYQLIGDRITFDRAFLTQSSGSYSAFLYATLVAVHELIHREQYRSWHVFFFWSRETDAYEAQREIARKWLAAKAISQADYDALMWRIEMSQRGYYDACEACEAIPEMFDVDDTFRKRYIDGSRHFFQGIWGLERNPKGPSRPNRFSTPVPRQ